MGLKNDKQHHAGARGGMTTYLFQHLLLAVFESTRSDDDIKAEIFAIAFFSTFLTLLPVDCATEPWIQIALVTEPPSKECANAFDVTIEVPLSRMPLSIWSPRYPEPLSNNAPFRVRVRGANHLREVDNDRLSRGPTYQNVEFVEVSVNETRSSESHYDLHERRI